MELLTSTSPGTYEPLITIVKEIMSTGFDITTSSDWIEVPGATALVDNYPGGEPEVLGFITARTFAFIDSVIESTGLVPVGQTVGDARLLPDGGVERIRLWIKLKPA